jgi:hypothetical protein
VSVFTRWKRSTTALVVAGAVVPLAVGSIPAGAVAAPVRSATTYTDTTYLQDALGLPVSDTAPVIEPVTYDRFQWLLKQPGTFAFLVGDPADPNFRARAQDVEAAAQAAAVNKVYWFDPNLSGSAKVGNTTEPGLDIRQPSGITSLTAASQTIYGYAWTSLIAQYLGNGYKATIATDPTGELANAAEGGTVTTAPDDAVVNDYGSTPGFSTEVGNVNGGALYDYTGGTDATATDDYFFVYDKDHVVTPDGDATAHASKIRAWVDLTGETDSTATKADVTTAVGVVGAANLAHPDQGAFWQSEVNAKYRGYQPAPAGNPTAHNDAPNSDAVLAAADVADWRIQQITYPQLVHLLDTDSTKNAIVLFGGTWCPNTRAVLQSVNKYAVQNDVKVVYNFDTVLDGGWIGGGPTSFTNPLQTRNYTGSGGSSDPTNANPSYLYGDLITNYLANIATEYDPTIGSGFVSFYPGGNNAKALKSVRKLQVPFLIGYQKGASASAGNGGITRQWIQQHVDVNGLPYFTEYMSQPYYTHPQPYGVNLNIPHDAAIWSTVNTDLARFTWKSDPTATALTAHYNTATDADDDRYLGSGDTATVTYNAAQNTVTAASATNGAVSVSPTALSAARTALGSSYPATRSAAQAALLVAEQAGTDPALVANLSTVFAAYSIAQSRKTTILNAWSSIQFGLEADAKLATFFGGLPGGVVSTQTVTAPAVSYGTAPRITISIANDYGRVPTGVVSLVVKKGTSTVASGSKAVAQNAASFTLSKLIPASYGYTLSYQGDDQITSFTRTGTLTVTKGRVSKVAGIVSKVPTTKTTGAYKVTITTATGLAKATGTVKITLRKGSSIRTLSHALTGGTATIVVPKLAKGTWTVAITWAGDGDYLAAAGTGASVKVTK